MLYQCEMDKAKVVVLPPVFQTVVQGELEQRVPSELSGRGLKLPRFVYVHT